MTKCSHDLCQNNAATGLSYCNRCIQLPTRECNFCNVEHQHSSHSCGDTTGSLLLDIGIELFVCLPLSALILAGLVICIMIAKFIAEYTTGIPFAMISGENILALWFLSYLLLFCWVRIGSMKIKWSD
jgi:hypothetical protein